MTHEEFELSAFVAGILLSGGEHSPISVEIARDCLKNWTAEEMELPEGITAEKLANEWNKQVNAY